MKKFFSFGVVQFTALAFAATALAMPSVFPTGVTVYDPAQAENGYVLISVDFENVFSKVDGKEYFTDVKNPTGPAANPKSSDKIFLIDMNGNVVKSWKDPGSNKKAYLLPEGNLLSISEFGSKAVEYNWDGKQVWEFATKLGPHHDGRRLENGNTLILCYENVPKAFNDKYVENLESPWFGKQDRKSLKLRGDTIIEVTPEGKIVWDWNSSEHLGDSANKYLPIAGLTDWTHGNTTSIIPPNKWFDAGDKRFKPGNILYNPRHFDSFIIIDKDTKEVVWSADFKAMGGISQCHEPIMIPKGYPGEGNMLFFDNGLFVRSGAHSGQSVVYEFNPTNNEVVWRYLPAVTGNPRFFSKYKGSAYKLANGNVLISEDYAGRVFQVKPDNTHPDGGSIVWEYQYDSVISRTTMYPYDFTPQLKAMPKPAELKVSPLNPGEWQVLPDAQRKDGAVLKQVKMN